MGNFSESSFPPVDVLVILLKSVEIHQSEAV